jgi:hypothetical protein
MTFRDIREGAIPGHDDAQQTVERRKQRAEIGQLTLLIRPAGTREILITQQAINLVEEAS